MVKKYPTEIVGKNFKGSSFPLLIKIIDAKKIKSSSSSDEKMQKNLAVSQKMNYGIFLKIMIQPFSMV